MSRIATISIRYVVRLLELAERDGANPAELLAKASITPIVDGAPDARIPVSLYYRLWDVTMAVLRDPSFPFRLVDQLDTASFDALGFAVITSPTLGEAYARIQRYLPFVTDGASWGTEEAGKTAILTFAQHETRTPEHLWCRHVESIGWSMRVFGAASAAVVGESRSHWSLGVQRV